MKRLILYLIAGLAGTSSFILATGHPFLPYVGTYQPNILRPGYISANDTFEISLSNHSTDTPYLDYELVTLGWRHTWHYGAHQWQIHIPYYHYSGGFLDAFISDWHKLFGLPNANRDTVKDNQFAVWLVDAQGNIVYSNTDAPSGFGDPSLHWDFSALHYKNLLFSTHTAITFPLGNEDALLGSGKIGGGLGISVQDTTASLPWRIAGHLIAPALPAIYDGLDTQLGWQVDGAIQASLFKISHTHVLTLYQPPLQAGQIAGLGDLAIIYTVEVPLKWNKKERANLNFQEDLNVTGAADFVIGLDFSLGERPPAVLDTSPNTADQHAKQNP